MPATLQWTQEVSNGLGWLSRGKRNALLAHYASWLPMLPC